MTKLDLPRLLSFPELPSYLVKIDQQMKLVTKSDNKKLEASCLALIGAGGKRLRPSLVLGCSGLNGRKPSLDTIKVAAAVELIHLGSLVHDDIIDQAETRHSLPTINQKAGVNHAIVVGDFLLAAGCALVAVVGSTQAKLVAETIQQLCAGQDLEMADNSNLQRTEKAYYQSIDGKTASLLAIACQLGGLQADLNNDQLDSLITFGYNFGRAFQIIDDLMDLLSTESLYGKPTGSDIKEGVYTLPVVLGLGSSQAVQLKKLIKTKAPTGKIVEQLAECGALQQTMKAIDVSIQSAETAAHNFPALQKMPTAYKQWVFGNLIAKQFQSLVS